MPVRDWDRSLCLVTSHMDRYKCHTCVCIYLMPTQSIPNTKDTKNILSFYIKIKYKIYHDKSQCIHQWQLMGARMKIIQQMNSCRTPDVLHSNPGPYGTNGSMPSPQDRPQPYAQGIYGTLRNKCAYISHRRSFLLSSCFTPFISTSCWQEIYIATTGTDPDTCQQIIIPIFFFCITAI